MAGEFPGAGSVRAARRGFLLGKFMPPHAGHQFLCDFARAYCDELTILVCSLEREPIPGDLRLAWMRELYPDCRVAGFTEEVPQEPGEHSHFWTIWREIVRAAHPEPIDVVFASEAYGARLAEEVGARFVPVDPLRAFAPVSGTAVRRDPVAAWPWLPEPVRRHYRRTVCLFGPESTGKTTLAAALAAEYATCVAPEYGRTYTEVFGVECRPEDLVRIALGHEAAMAAAAKRAGPLMICDTDPVLTAVWSDMLTGGRDPQLANAPLCDLYLLTDVDEPWVDDGTRYFPDESTRRRFFQACERELVVHGARYVRIGGPYETRLAQARAAIDDAFPAVRQALNRSARRP